MKTVCTALFERRMRGVYRVAIAHRRRYRYGGRARRAGDEKRRFPRRFRSSGAFCRTRPQRSQPRPGRSKATIGIFGLLAVAAICLPPVLTLGVRFFVYKLTAAVCECVADKRFSELISNLGTAFALLLAINGAGAMMLFLSLYSLIQTVV